MNPDIIVPITAILTGGAIILTPLLALAARFALKPAVEAFAKLKETQGGGEAALVQDRRISLLEAEVQGLQAQVERLREAEDFRRQLEAGQPTPALANGAAQAQLPAR